MKISFYNFSYISVFAVLFILPNCKYSDFNFSTPLAVRGVLDLRNYDFQHDKSVNLDGEWEFYWGKFRSDLKANDEPEYIQVPGKWNDFLYQGKPIGSKGYAMYRLKVLLPQNSSGLAVKYPAAEGGSRIYINGQAFESGKAGRTEEETTSVRWHHIIIPFEKSSTLELEIDASNFGVYLSGIKNSLELGNQQSLAQKTEKDRFILAMMTAGVFILGLYHLLYFFLYRKKAILYFALFFIIIGIRNFIFKEGLVYIFFPDLNLRTLLIVEFGALYLLPLIFALYLHVIFPHEFKKWIRNLFIAANSILLLSLLLHPSRFTRMVELFNIISLMIIFFIFYTAIAAVYRKRPYAIIFFLSFVLLGVSISQDILIHLMFGNIITYPPGRMLLFAIFQSLFIAGNVMNQEKEKVKAIEGEKRYRWMSFTDDLTGLFNKRYFNIQSEYIEKLARESNLPYAVVMMDIDNFKKINDTCGHLEGDRILKEISRIILSRLRTDDHAFRFGGEEIVLLLPGTDREGAFTLAEIIRESIQNNIFLSEEKINSIKYFFKMENSRSVTVSVGIAISGQDEKVQELLHMADEAMYKAKKAGKNRTVLAKNISQ